MLTEEYDSRSLDVVVVSQIQLAFQLFDLVCQRVGPFIESDGGEDVVGGEQVELQRPQLQLAVGFELEQGLELLIQSIELSPDCIDSLPIFHLNGTASILTRIALGYIMVVTSPIATAATLIILRTDRRDLVFNSNDILLLDDHIHFDFILGFLGLNVI
jgi:hypothetical protein